MAADNNAHICKQEEGESDRYVVISDVRIWSSRCGVCREAQFRGMLSLYPTNKLYQSRESGVVSILCAASVNGSVTPETLPSLFPLDVQAGNKITPKDLLHGDR